MNKCDNLTTLNKILTSGNILPLAFLGDSVHTLFVREYFLKNLNTKIGTISTSFISGRSIKTNYA